MTWRDRARCRGMDPDLFDINAEGNTGTLGLRICTGLHPSGDYLGDCPVRAECLGEALSYSSLDDYGVLGGTTSDARSEVRAGRLDAKRAMARGNQQATRWTRDEKLQLRAERLLEQAKRRIA
jgi:hypothetical protein